jgi:hypothetical protein
VIIDPPCTLKRSKSHQKTQKSAHHGLRRHGGCQEGEKLRANFEKFRAKEEKGARARMTSLFDFFDSNLRQKSIARIQSCFNLSLISQPFEFESIESNQSQLLHSCVMVWADVINEIASSLYLPFIV